METTKIIYYISRYLDMEESCNPIEVQKFISEQKDEGGVNLPLDEIRSTLMFMEICHLIDGVNNVYFPHYRNQVVVEKKIELCNFDTGFPLYSMNL